MLAIKWEVEKRETEKKGLSVGMEELRRNKALQISGNKR